MNFKELAEKAAKAAKAANINDLMDSVGANQLLNSQNNESKESTKVSSVDKSSLHILVGIIVIANIFTYNSFKFLNSTNKSQIELAILYVIIYVYTVLYSIAICYMSKWVIRLAEVGDMVIEVDSYIEFIEKLIKNCFDLAIYTLPFHIFIGILSLSFQKHLMFDYKGNYLWSYQLFSCIISLILAYMYHDKDISLDAEQIIRYYIIFVTVLSLVKLNVNIGGASTINRFADGIVSFFLNVNLKKIVILIPLIMMIFGIAMLAFGIDIPTIIQYTCICLAVFLIILLLGGTITYISKELGLNLNPDKPLIKLPIALKAISKWFIFMAVYLIPLYAYIALMKGELIQKFTNEFINIFNINFQKILGMGTFSLFFLNKILGVMDEKQMTKMSSLIILVAILLSKITTKSEQAT